MQAQAPLDNGPEPVGPDIVIEPLLEDPADRRRRERRAAERLAIAVTLAILLHLTVVLLTVTLPDLWSRPKPPEAIPITIVQEPPPPPPPPTPPAPPTPAEKPPPPPALPFAQSGPDEKMASAPTEEPPPPTPGPAPPATEAAPETAPQPTPPAPKAPEPPAPSTPVPAPEAPQPAAKPLPPPKPAAPKATPKPKPRSLTSAAPPGEREMTGDRYLNAVMAKIKQNYKYPDSFRRDGLAGSVVFQMTLARNGEIVGLDLVLSSGNSAIDLYAEEVLRRSSPVPPVPASLPGATLSVRAVINVTPH